jgi:uncharacterized protein (UPF0264 family)/N-acetylglutamate synthase-like GNAT family acetyltransferase
MRLLVSVTDTDEARAAVAGGVDVVDVKNPAEGSLGAPVPGVIERVRAVVPPALPVSVAIGDLPHLPGTAALAARGAARAGATYVKVGLWGSSTEDEAVAVLEAVRAAVDGEAAVIAGAYADGERVPSRPLPPGGLVAAATRAGVAGCLLDTAVKDGRGLFEWLAPERLSALVADAHAAGLELALAGALRAEDLAAVRATGADIAGVRSAACLDGRRDAPLDPERIARLRALCDVAPGEGAALEGIRDADPSEAAELEALQLRASLVWEEYREQLLAHPDAIELPEDTIRAGHVRVALVDGKRAGFSVVTDVRDGVCELDGLFVEPALMGRGIGRELVADVVARASGARRLDVIANPRAREFYEKAGFRAGEPAQTRFGPALRMHRTLE